MNLFQTAELATVDFAISYFTPANIAALESEAGPLEIQIVGQGIKIADAWFAKLPFGIGGMLNGLLEGYAGQLPQDINTYITTTGAPALIQWLKALAAHISAG